MAVGRVGRVQREQKSGESNNRAFNEFFRFPNLLYIYYY